MDVAFKRGVYLPELDLWLDSLRRRDFGLISHAHSDHTARHTRPVLTRNTGRLLSDYLDGSALVYLDYHEPLETKDYVLTLYPAGHCLGSAQALVESKATGVKLLYTGDIKPRSSPTNEPLEPVSCDILVMESTYGRPEYTFPPQDKVMANAFHILRSWLTRGARPVVQAWRLGKSQELIHLLLGAGFDVAAEESVYRIARIYEEGGVEFPGSYRCFDGSWPEGQVLISPPGKKNQIGLDGQRGLMFMELTGWAVGQDRPWGRRADSSLPYSDHADFNELVEYVGQVAPKQVYTVNGFPELSAHLRQLGYPAVHLDSRGRTVDAGFQLKML
ncbi:MAG: hypothetical protein BZY81_00720 [SAR202 cluster bacterium Io17-Chloro-G4]|nr:MAG: hypothetical protein BZY81_00720 [SAR202 cluster bacterium Io17-Chloro-G4]